MKEKLKTNYLYIFIGIVIFSFILYFIVSILSTNYKIAGNQTVYEQNNSINVYTENNSYELYEIASYSTQIYDNDKNRIHNITKACNTLNGTIVASGTEFSFNNTLGKMDKEDGYKKALGFDSNGNKIKMYGGGICQISSTLYNAVLIANLEVTERHAHSRRVNYVPKNKDATIYYGVADFKFINNTENYIVINALTDGTTVTVELMSESYKISKPLMWFAYLLTSINIFS